MVSIALSVREEHSIPTVPGQPLIHNLLDLVDDPLLFFWRSYQKLGPAFRVKAPTRDYVCLAGPDANRFLLHHGDQHLDHVPLYRHIPRQVCSNQYAMSASGEHHAHLRKSLKAGVTHNALGAYVTPMLQAAQTALEQMPSVISVNDLMHRLVAEQVGAALLHHQIGSRLNDAIRFARISIGAGLGSYPGFVKHSPAYLGSRSRFLKMMHQIVAEHRRIPPGDSRAPDFVDMLLTMTRPDGTPFTDEDIVANAQMLYSNSVLYAAPASGFLLYGILTNPSVRARVQAEIDELFRDGFPAYPDLTRAPALRGTVLESMRRYPIALATPRVVAKPFSLAGYHLPVGERVLFAVTVTHFIDKYFPDPWTFDIDRYQAPRNEHHQAGMFVRFGMGEHACIGVNLVELIMLTTIATLLHTYDISLSKSTYVLKRVVNPFPEPDRHFSIRLQQRQ